RLPSTKGAAPSPPTVEPGPVGIYHGAGVDCQNPDLGQARRKRWPRGGIEIPPRLSYRGRTSGSRYRMKAARWLPVLMVASLGGGAPVFAAAPSPRDTAAVPAEDEAPWSIRNGCIDNYLIKRVSFRDDRSGVLELS